MYYIDNSVYNMVCIILIWCLQYDMYYIDNGVYNMVCSYKANVVLKRAFNKQCQLSFSVAC